ncbi:MAG: hypothetical protein JST12_07515 [Armatimonadetes bacterium]|nr:hypothetical protein [Armatimonadota bacterium]
MKRTDLQDTSIDMHRARVLLVREKGLKWRVDKTMQLCDESRDLYPDQTKRLMGRVPKLP